MATSSLTAFKPAQIFASMAGPDPNRKTKPSSASWWTPLFGWQSEPDYMSPAKNPSSDMESEPDRPRSKFFPGCFTEEKAKELRRKTLECSTFHDAMYHSAIASRLATDLSAQKDDE